MDFSKVPAWILSVAICVFAVGFVLSVFFLEDERMFMGMSFGKPISISDDIQKRWVEVEKQGNTLHSVQQANNELQYQNKSLQKELKLLSSKVSQLNERLSDIAKVQTSSNVNTLGLLPTPNVQATATSKSLKFDLSECIKIRAKVECTVSVTNITSDTKSFQISSSTEVYNEFGVKSLISSVTAGGRVFDMGPRKRMEYGLVKNIPLEVKLHFADVDSTSTQFTALNIIGNKGDARSNYKAELRGIVLL